MNCAQIFAKGKKPLEINADTANEDLSIEKIGFDREEFAASEFDNEILWDRFLEEKLISKGFNVILIDRNVEPQEALIIIGHVRLAGPVEFSRIPIIYYSLKRIEQILLVPSLSHKDVLMNGEIDFVWEGNYENDKEVADKLKRVIIKNTELKVISISNLKVYPNKQGSRHQITNEWGAVLLAHVAGLDHLIVEIEKNQINSKTIYYKYLKQLHGINTQELPEKNLVEKEKGSKKFLFIDDNYDKGWDLVFQGILGQVDSDLYLEVYTSIEKFEDKSNEINSFQEVIEQIEQENYQGVLLDLRLSKEDDNPNKLNTNIEEFTGGRLLQKIKGAYPHIPVIITTASNKAWNMEQLIEMGADGYFIKQGPDSFPNISMARENYESFKKLLSDAQEKYKQLEPFWKFIKEIDNATLIEERQVMVSENGSQVQKDTKVNERIKERLQMFFGLLKRSYEDTQYNERFHYSGYKLAFMTLWSCLNDIQFIYYEKSLAFTSNNGRENYNIRITASLINKLSLPCSNDLEFYLQKKEVDKDKFETCLKVDYQATDPYTLLPPSQPIRKVNFTNNIGEQIGFLLLAFGEGTNILDSSSGLISARILANDLVCLKNKRNKLFLTHGNEEEGSGFFIKKEIDNPEITLEDCAQLFEIVYFLLKATFIKIDL
ncbi:MAG: response regulator [Leptospiraceae bacterium]|nr:response regulator [Leptospiraceae bacterium]